MVSLQVRACMCGCVGKYCLCILVSANGKVVQASRQSSDPTKIQSVQENTHVGEEKVSCECVYVDVNANSQPHTKKVPHAQQE